MLRTARLALELQALSALTPGPVSVRPVAGTLAAWHTQLPVAPADTDRVQGTFDIEHAALQSAYWALLRGGASAADQDAAAEAAQQWDVVKLPKPVLVEGHWRREVNIAVERKVSGAAVHAAREAGASQRAGDGGAAAASSIEATLNDCALMLPWRFRGGAGKAARPGLLVLPPVHMAGLIAGSALRMTATLPQAQQTATHSCTLTAPRAGSYAETAAEVRLRVRNCGARRMSLCIECGELGGRAGPLARPPGGAAATSAASQDLHLVLTARSRHQWLGLARRHVLSLPAQGEQECVAKLAFTGCGAFSVDGITCTWNVPEANILGRMLQGERIEVFVIEPTV